MGGRGFVCEAASGELDGAMSMGKPEDRPPEVTVFTGCRLLLAELERGGTWKERLWRVLRLMVLLLLLGPLLLLLLALKL